MDAGRRREERLSKCARDKMEMDGWIDKCGWMDVRHVRRYVTTIMLYEKERKKERKV